MQPSTGTWQKPRWQVDIDTKILYTKTELNGNGIHLKSKRFLSGMGITKVETLLLTSLQK